MERKVTSIFFSPGGSTKRIVEEVASVLSKEVKFIDLLKEKVEIDREFTPSDIVVVGMPVFAGRIPTLCVNPLEKIKGNGAKAIAVVTFGNREYDDALLELVDILEGNDFDVVGAGAFVSQHTIFPTVGEGRPDESDLEKVHNFAMECIPLLDSDKKGEKISTLVKGNRPYREATPIPLKPTGDEKCNECGSCVTICPVHAIDKSNPRKTDMETCITCTACISICPTKARGFHGMKYAIAKKAFEKKNAERKEPEVFYKEK